MYLRLSDNVDNYLLHLLAVQLICDGQWWLAEWSEWWKSTEMWNKPPPNPKSSRNEKLNFILHSTSDDWPSDRSNKSWPKWKKRPPKSSKNEMLIFVLHSTSDDWPCNPTNKSWLKCRKRPAKSSKNEIFILYYVQLLMISQAIWVMKVDQNAKKWNAVSLRVFCCFS